MEIFESWTLAGKTLRNRIIKTATFEGMCPGGKVTDRLIEFHRRHAEGGVAISTVAYGAVSRDARTFNDQIVLEEENFDDLCRLTAAIRNEGAIASIQLAHCRWLYPGLGALKLGLQGAERRAQYLWHDVRLSHCRAHVLCGHGPYS